MEQHELRQWEHRCIQEEKPECVARCPLHVDARQFCSLMAQRRWDKAWAVLVKTMPLPGVLARLCEAPCREACVRKDAGGAIELGALERFCAQEARPVPPPRPLPSRGKSVAVLGGNMAGLCAAWEMSRRGFDVSLYCGDPGADLRELVGSVLPQGSVERELENLSRLGCHIEPGVDCSAELLESLLEGNDAVFVDVDAIPDGVRDFGEPDELTLGTRRSGLFCSRAGETRIIEKAATGRRAANSIERYTQGVSMVSGREREGAYETRLFTSLDKVETMGPACGESCTEAEARDEARRCLQCECMECVKVCEYLRHYKSYPKIYVRQIYNNDSIVMGTRQANTMINSCMLCGLCKTVCPEDFDMAEVCLDARRSMVEKGKMPPSAHEFALRDMDFANSDKCTLARHAPGAQSSSYVFFPGCQLAASDPEGVEAAYADLRARLGDVGLMLQCCGAPAHWAGRREKSNELAGALAERWRELGEPRIIAACPSCASMLRQELAGAEIVSHWTVLRELGPPEGAATPQEVLAVNDPCAARGDRMVQEDFRAMLKMMGVSFVEPDLSGDLTQCCGYGGLLNEANPELGKRVSKLRAGGVDEDWVTYCVMCRDLFAKSGKRALHMYDLLYPRSDDAASRPAPGYSGRRENRVRLREGLLKRLWRETGEHVAEPHEAVGVTFSDRALEAMETRRILKSDVQKVLMQVLETGRYLVNDDGRRLASFRPAVVTYWVEFEQDGETFVVQNAWSHRMRIKGGQP